MLVQVDDDVLIERFPCPECGVQRGTRCSGLDKVHHQRGAGAGKLMELGHAVPMLRDVLRQCKVHIDRTRDDLRTLPEDVGGEPIIIPELERLADRVNNALQAVFDCDE